MFRFCIENSIEEKVIEKAYKKLRLDALVIQQGRLTENAGTKVGHQAGAPGTGVTCLLVEVIYCGVYVFVSCRVY